MANIPIGGQLSPSTSVASLDVRFGPYSSIQSAYNAIVDNFDEIVSGLHFGIIQSDGSIKEYAWTLTGGTASDYKEIGAGGGSSVTVIDALDSNSSTAALSAKQGKILAEQIAAKPSLPIQISDVAGLQNALNNAGGSGGTSVTIVNNLTSDSTTDALSAKQGKVLAGMVTDVQDSLGDIETTINNLPIFETLTNGNLKITFGGESYVLNKLSTLHVIVTASPSTGGYVTGGGNYTEGSSFHIYATAASGFHFVKWDDNNTELNREVIASSSKLSYTAYFEADSTPSYTITTSVSPASSGTVTGGGTYNSGATATLTAVANEGYVFSQWNDGNTSNPRTITVSENKTYTASFNVVPTIETYTVTLSANPSNGGVVTGGGTFDEGSSITISATANTGYHFVKWNDNNTNASRTITVTADASYQAIFEADEVEPEPQETSMCKMILLPKGSNSLASLRATSLTDYVAICNSTYSGSTYSDATVVDIPLDGTEKTFACDNNYYIVNVKTSDVTINNWQNTEALVTHWFENSVMDTDATKTGYTGGTSVAGVNYDVCFAAVINGQTMKVTATKS